MDIKCELWLDGSFVTKCPEPDDIDGSLMLHLYDRDIANDEVVKYLKKFDDTERPFHQSLDIFLCIVYPRLHVLGQPDDPDGWAKHWSGEHNSRWIKGFAVIPFR